MESNEIDVDKVLRTIFEKAEDKAIYKKMNQLQIEEEFKAVWDFALKRFRFGSIEYGEWSPDADSRDILEEVKEEIGDVVIYSGMLMIKLNRLMKQLEVAGLRKQNE